MDLQPDLVQGGGERLDVCRICGEFHGAATALPVRKCRPEPGGKRHQGGGWQRSEAAEAEPHAFEEGVGAGPGGGRVGKDGRLAREGCVRLCAEDRQVDVVGEMSCPMRAVWQPTHMAETSAGRR